jgi:Do/DeqQ family serine protease
MRQKRLFVSLLLASFLGGVVAITGYRFLVPQRVYESFEQVQNVRFSNYLADSNFIIPEGLNFVYAAERVRPAVVHIKTWYQSGTAKNWRDDEESDALFKEFHGSPYGRMPSHPRESAGSGVIISPDGYIITNNHVIEKASKIEVILNDKRSYAGTIIGTDPTTDLALLKVEEVSLPFVKYGSSDQLKIGEWVLAIGNPFDLTSTVTAGIVSAKGRNINILRTEDGNQVECFIQTDAAVNPGNSGGALVNLKGELIGINTAIATGTGVSQGYSFAVPVALASKVMDDLLKYGTVQRALLGVKILDIDAGTAKEKSIEVYRGVYVDEVNDNSAAGKAGIKAGDIILRINGNEINSTSELQATVATYHPGDRIEVMVLRGGDEKSMAVVLRNSAGEPTIAKTSINNKPSSIFGAVIQPLSTQEKSKMNLRDGVRISKLGPGKFKDAGLKEGFVITHLNYKAIRNIDDILKVIRESRTATLVEGISPGGVKGYHAVAP